MKFRALLCSALLVPSMAGSLEIEHERPILFSEASEYIGHWIRDSDSEQEEEIFEIAADYVHIVGCGSYPYQLLDSIEPDERNDYVAFEVLMPPGQGCLAPYEERIIYLVRISRGAARIHLSRCPSYESLAYKIAKSGRTNCSGEFHYKRTFARDD